MIFMLPLSMAIPNLFLPLLIIIFFLIKHPQTLNKEIIISITAFVCFFILKGIVQKTFSQDFSVLKHLLTVLVLCFLTFKVKNKLQVKVAYISGVFVAIIVSLFKIAHYYLKNSVLPFGNSELVHQLLLIDRPYIGFMCVLAVIYLVKLYKDYTRYKLLIVGGVILFVFYVLLISARLSALTLLIVFFLSLIESKNIHKKQKAVVVFALVLAPSLLFLNPNFRERLKLQDTFNESITSFIDYEPRFVIWKCSKELLLSQNILLGRKGFKNVNDNQINCYENSIKKESKRKFYIESKFNTHNQFLDVFLVGGILGLLLLLNVFYRFFKFGNGGNYAVLVAFILFFILENVLWRQWGAYLFGILLPLSTLKSDSFVTNAKNCSHS